MIALIVDGFSDPLIGHISDRFHSRLGRRHFFMYLSALPCALVYYLLWNPPAGWGTGALFWYLLITAIVVRILIALYEVPSAALLAELTEDYDLRTSLVAYRFFFGYLGAVLMGVIALSVFLRPTAQQSARRSLENRPACHRANGAATAISPAGTLRKCFHFLLSTRFQFISSPVIVRSGITMPAAAQTILMLSPQDVPK